jgi:hypothetical protein
MVIELLSPSNKRKNSEGLLEYKRKQSQVLESSSHLLEIDLLRDGEHVVHLSRRFISRPYDFLIALADANDRQESKLWRLSLRNPLPVLELPLTPDSAPVFVDLQEAFERAWDESDYSATIDYTVALEPPLSEEDAARVAERVNSRA